MTASFDVRHLDPARARAGEIAMHAKSFVFGCTALLAIIDHRGARSMDAAAYFAGHGFTKVKSVRGGIDAWSGEVDAQLPRYELE